MKTRIRLFAVILTAAAFFALVGCSARTPITADEFTKQAKAQGFTVKEETASDSKIVKYLSANESKTETQLIFISFATQSDAQDSFLSIKKNIPHGTNVKTTTLDSSSYNKYTLTNGELNYTLVRMNDTLVYGKTNSDHQSQVDSFMKSIKY